MMRLIQLDVALLATGIGLILTLGGIVIAGYKLWARFAKLEELIQKHEKVLCGSEDTKSRLERLERHSEKDKETQDLILHALFAIIDGLKQQGCNGQVTEAHAQLRGHVIKH